MAKAQNKPHSDRKRAPRRTDMILYIRNISRGAAASQVGRVRGRHPHATGTQGSSAYLDLDFAPPATPRIQAAPLPPHSFRIRMVRFVMARRRNRFDSWMDTFDLGGVESTSPDAVIVVPSPDPSPTHPLPALVPSFPSIDQPGASPDTSSSGMYAYIEVYDRPSPNSALAALEQYLSLLLRSPTPRSWSESYAPSEYYVDTTPPVENTLGFSPPLAHLVPSATNTCDATVVDNYSSDDGSPSPRLIGDMLAFPDHPDLIGQNPASSPRLTPLDINGGPSSSTGYSADEYSSNGSSFDIPMATSKPSTPTTLATESTTWDLTTMYSPPPVSSPLSLGDLGDSLPSLEAAQWLSFSELSREVVEDNTIRAPSGTGGELFMQDTSENSHWGSHSHNQAT
ncbi:hypothetical protein VTO73DRAFT_2744 [Trametes versicolor]